MNEEAKRAARTIFHSANRKGKMKTTITIIRSAMAIGDCFIVTPLVCLRRFGPTVDVCKTMEETHRNRVRRTMAKPIG